MSNLTQMNSQENIVHGSFRKGFVARTLNRLRMWNQRRLAILELSAMPDSLLRDLGIERYQIEDVVTQAGTYVKLPSAESKPATVAPLQKVAA